jgi:hypothetical protein
VITARAKTEPKQNQNRTRSKRACSTLDSILKRAHTDEDDTAAAAAWLHGRLMQEGHECLAEGRMVPWWRECKSGSHLHAPVVAEVIDLEAVFDHLDGKKLRSACGTDA